MPLIDYKTSFKDLIAINCNNNCNNIDNNAKKKDYSLENELKLAPTAKDFELKLLSTTPINTSNCLKENNNINQRYSNKNKKNIEIFVNKSMINDEKMLQYDEEDECLWKVIKEIIGAFI